MFQSRSFHLKHADLTSVLIQSCVCSAVGTGQTSLFGNNQTKLGTTLGTMGTFGTSGFNSGTSTLGFGAPQQPVGEQLNRLCDESLNGCGGLIHSDPLLLFAFVWLYYIWPLSSDTWWWFDSSFLFLQHSLIQTQQLPNMPSSSSSSVSWRIHPTETRHCSETRCQTLRKKRRWEQQKWSCRFRSDCAAVWLF